MNWKYKAGDLVVFNTTDSEYRKNLNGRECSIVRRLTEDEADFCETGPMYEVKFNHIHEFVGTALHDLADNYQIHVFEDELEETDELKFERMVDTYRALGYRIVAFEMYDEVNDCHEGGWIQAFDTHGVNAEELPKEAFKVPANEPWEKAYGWDILDDGVRVYDETDEVDWIFGSYDITGNMPVNELAENYR